MTDSTKSTLPGGAPRRNLPSRSWGVLFSALGATLFISGCASPTQRVLTSANAYMYHEARYEENCVQKAATGCLEAQNRLKEWKKRLKEASDAVSRGGSLPLQLKALKEAEGTLK